MGSATKVYRDELLGEIFATVALFGLCKKQVLIQKHEMSLMNYSNEPLYYQRVQSHLDIAADDDDFVALNAYINSEYKKAITSLYEKFFPLSSPILTQRTVYSFTARFKITLPIQYKAIICLLNKGGTIKHLKVTKNKFLWDWYTLYLFLMLIRIRNSKDFVWWDMCNASSHYGHGSSNLLVFFGISVYQTSILCRFDEVNQHHFITMKTIK